MARFAQSASRLDDHRVDDFIQLGTIRSRRPGEVLDDDDESCAVNVEDVGLPAVGRPLRVDLAVPEPPAAFVTPWSVVFHVERLGRTDDVDALAGVAPIVTSTGSEASYAVWSWSAWTRSSTVGPT